MTAKIKPDPIKISHVLVYSGSTNLPQTQTLRSQLAFLNQPRQAGSEHLPATGLLIVLTSWGGNTFEARSLYGLIRALSFPVEIHATGVIQSAAIPLMLAADRRTAAPDTSFLFHAWQWAVDAHPGHSIDGLNEFNMRLDDEMKWARKVLEERSNLTGDEIDRLRLFSSPRIVDTDFAVQHELVHEVLERKIPTGVMTWNIGA